MMVFGIADLYPQKYETVKEIFYCFRPEKMDNLDITMDFSEENLVKRVKFYSMISGSGAGMVIEEFVRILKRYQQITKRYFIGIRIEFDDFEDMLVFLKRVSDYMKKEDKIMMWVSGMMVDIIVTSLDTRVLKRILKFIPLKWR